MWVDLLIRICWSAISYLHHGVELRILPVDVSASERRSERLLVVVPSRRGCQRQCSFIEVHMPIQIVKHRRRDDDAEKSSRRDVKYERRENRKSYSCERERTWTVGMARKRKLSEQATYESISISVSRVRGRAGPVAEMTLMSSSSLSRSASTASSARFALDDLSTSAASESESERGVAPLGSERRRRKSDPEGSTSRRGLEPLRGSDLRGAALRWDTAEPGWERGAMTFGGDMTP